MRTPVEAVTRDVQPRPKGSLRLTPVRGFITRLDSFVTAVPVVTRVDVAAVGVGLGVIAAYFWLVAGGGLHLDDIRAQAYASGRSYWPFVVESNRTHLSPGARSIDWLHVTTAPYDYRLAVGIILTVVMLLTIAVWLLLRTTFGPTSLALYGLSVSLLAPSMIPGLAWYRQAITGATGLTFILFALTASLAFAYGRHAIYGLLAVTFHAIGLMFSERVILVPVVALVAFLVLGPPARRRQGVLIIVLGLVNLAFLSGYASGDYDDGRSGTPNVSGLVLSTSRSFFVNILPSLIGGPVRWRPGIGGYSFADTLPVVALAAWLLVVFLVVIWVRRRPPQSLAIRVLTIAMSYILPIYALLYYTRVSRAEIRSVDDLRLFPEVTVASVFVALAVVRDIRSRPGRSWLIDTRRWVVPTVSAILAAVSWLNWGSAWHETNSRAYFDSARQSIASSRGPIVPTSFPDSILPAFFQTDISAADMARSINPGIDTELTNGPSFLVGWDGEVRRAGFFSVGESPPGSGFCGYYLPTGGGSLTVPLTEDVAFRRSALIQLRVLVGDETNLTVDLVDSDGEPHRISRPVRPTLLRGPQTLVYPIPWQTVVRSVVISADEGHPDICVHAASVIVPFDPEEQS